MVTQPFCPVGGGWDGHGHGSSNRRKHGPEKPWQL